MKEELWTDGDTCYVPYPQPGSDERRTWYEARNKCLHLNGDLATNGITSVVLRRLETDEEYRTSSRNKRYWIGLQRDPLMKSLSGMRPFSNRPIKICYTTTFSCSSVPWASFALLTKRKQSTQVWLRGHDYSYSFWRRLLLCSSPPKWGH